jgi:hypothetical protein
VLVWLALGCSLPAFPAEEAAPAAEATAPAPPAETPAQPQLQFAPFQFQPSLGGSVDYTLRHDTIGGIKSRSQALTVAVNAGADVNSFIWQPWFAQVSGGLGLNTYLSDTNYNAGAGAATKNQTATSIVTGKVALDVVPLSRFPFKANYQKDDNRQNIGVASINSATQDTHFGMSQQYRTLSGQTNYSANYDQNLWEGAYFGEARQKQLGLEMRTALSPNQDLTITGTRALNESSASNQSTLSNTLVANHNYRPAASVTVQNMFNLGKMDYRLPQGTTEDNNMQLTSFASWLSHDRPLTITGNARLAEINNSPSTTAPATQQSSANFGVGANYQISRQVRSYANANVNLNDNKISGTQNMSSNEAAGADYISDLIDWGSFKYGTHASGNLSNNNAAPYSTQGLMLSAGHNLNRSSIDSGNIRLDANVDQTATANKATHNPSSTSLSHSGSLGWTIPSAQGTTGLRLSASDFRTMSGLQNFYQLVNLQANRSETMTRNSSLSGDVTIQASRQGTGNAPRTSTTTTSASLNYAQQRLFGMPRLDFTSELRIYGDALPLAVGPQTQASRSWSNHLGYTIGRLETMVEAVFAESNHINQSTLLFRMRRVF